MNKNKIIFGIIGAILIALFIFWVFALRSSTNKWGIEKTKSDTFNIWVVWDDKGDFLLFLENFKSIKPEYKKTIINVESFTNYEEYYYALTSAITKWKAPDIFVLNNGEKEPVFFEQISGIDPNIINPNDFRKKYKWVFWDNLILTYTDSEWKEKEFLAGVPVWYETLWIFYNRRYIKSADLTSLPSLNNLIGALRKRFPNVIPIWIWNGSTVYGVADIVTQFFMLESWVNKLLDVTGTKLKQSLASYLLFGDDDGKNAYNSKFTELKTLGQDNLDLFSKWETFMVMWYPRLIKKIDEKGFSKSFLRAEPFPHYFSWDGKTLLNYHYFVMNKETSNYPLGADLLSYLTTDSGASAYLSKFPYYLPSLLSLESDKLEEKIEPNYNIVLKDFYNSDFELASFDRGIKNIYDRDIVSILDNSSNYENSFNAFRRTIICKANKLVSLENLSNKCE